MINGLNHTSTDTASLSEGAVLNAKQGFRDRDSTGTATMSFAAMLLDTEAKNVVTDLGLSLSESDESLELTTAGTDELTDLSADISDNFNLVSVSVTTVNNSVKDSSVTAASSMVADSIVTAVSNVMSTSASLASAQVATSQLATNSVLDGKLIDATTVKEPTVAADALLNNNSQTARNEVASNLQFKAVMDKSLSTQELGERLSATIADKVSVQVNAKTPTATIRLDPPDLGKIELVVKLDHDKLHVQINASSSTTRESIQMTSDRLRAELVEQNFLNVDVSVTSEHQQNTEQDFFAFGDDLIVASNAASLDLNEEQEIDNSELARA
ncbi:flagellar hook-length control protein FliK [Vibrio ziniensis]|uniref:Flagellar hook-length control protein-like C-terminal domain-containing protein n=1 Tax=Vibrio ziniensis TaxID=2711221 RepID=A0A6G7CHD0_9VIBR|nr:flagellar hook-length control protein FliK [Vibrio ziniensis]QIH41499.1 hypothetical protein G5S32_05605 [Vibrio ziniensis]